MGVWDKVSNVFFKDEDEDEVEYAQESSRKDVLELKEPATRDVWQEPDMKKTRKGQLVSVPTGGTKQMEMMLVKAKSYDDMQSIAQNIKDRKVVIVNFEDLDKDIAQRMVDFLSGAVFALDGVSKKVSRGTLIFSSSRVDLEGQIMDGEFGVDSTGQPTFNAGNLWKTK